MICFAVAYPAETHAYGHFSAVPGMSRPRTVAAPAHAAPRECPLTVLADTADRAAAFDAAALEVFRHAAGAPTVCRDPLSWLTLQEVRHAARMAGCPVLDPASEDPAPNHWDPATDLAGC